MSGEPPGPDRPPDGHVPDWVVEGEDETSPDGFAPVIHPRPTISRSAAVVVALLAVVALVVAVPRVLAGSSEPELIPARSQPEPSTSASVDTARVLSMSAAPTPSASGATSTAGGVVLVHVVGQVRHPGLVRLDAGARVADALAKAGGASRRADLTAVNLARVVVDGEQIFIPAPGQAPPAVAGPAPSGSAGAGSPIDLNTATEADLDALPGVGPVIAGRIVAWRQEHGRFSSVDELTEVSGIGDATMARLRPLVRT
jgi:competence protein ComEA